MSESVDNATVQLEVKLDRLCNGIEAVKERQDEMAEDIGEFTKLKKAFTDGTHEMIPGKTSYMIWDGKDSDGLVHLYSR